MCAANQPPALAGLTGRLDPQKLPRIRGGMPLAWLETVEN
jgi:hypothetical protein